jgi:ABC-2 type transport system ATP-binding protein
MGVVECESLTKKYGGRAALDGFCVSVEEGEILGLLGPNGAGKTTLFRLLLGLARPHSGSIRIMGRAVPSPSSVQCLLGAVVEEPAFYRWMDASRTLRAHARAVGFRLRPGLIDETLERVGLGDVGKKSVKDYSQGMRQRLGLGRAILHAPKLVILDEPANGLDPGGIVWLRRLLLDLAATGTTVIVSSHQLGEIEKVCDRVAIMDHGRLVDVGPVSEIGSSGNCVRVVLRAEDAEAGARFVDQCRLAGYGVDVTHGGTILVRNAASRELLGALLAEGLLPEVLMQEQSSLENRFLEITGEAG